MNIVVGGCSFSSAFKVDEAYPYIISKDLKLGFINEAQIQASNNRIWRVITKHILNNTVVPTDKLIIQYTEQHRKEFWVPHRPTTYDDVHEKFDTGRLFRFKYGADHYAQQQEVKLYHTIMRCSNAAYDKECFEVNHAQFEGFLKHRGFESVVFVKTRYCDFTADYPVIDCDDILQQYSDDGWHLSQQGHIEVAQRLCKVIQS